MMKPSIRAIAPWAPVLLILTVLAAPCFGGAEVHDRPFREGWAHLDRERFAEARAEFAKIPPAEYDLGDYVLYFTGMAYARERKRPEAAEAAGRLEGAYPRSPLLPYMRHEIAFASALDNDLPAARAALSVSRGKVTGGGRKSEELYVAGLLAEEGGPTAEAAALHLENFATYTAQSAAAMSYERLWGWWKEGRLASFPLPVGFYARLGKAVGRAGDFEKARAVYEDAVSRFPESTEYYNMVLDYAELLRKQGETAAATALLSKRFAEGLPLLRAEMRYLQARVDWKAGKLAEARKGFLEVAAESPTLATAERARYQAAWISMDEGDIAGATESFGMLRLAADNRTRQESIFRHAYGLYLQKRYDEAVISFRAGERGGFGEVESARHRFWRARALRESGEAREAERLLAGLSADSSAGIYALLALKDQGRDPFGMLNAPSSGETDACRQERDILWGKVLGAPWEPADMEKVRRVARLGGLGVANYAVLESQRVDRGAMRKALGLADEGAAGLFRYLAGDLRGAIRETAEQSIDLVNSGLIDRIRYPLAPEFLGDCDARQSGLDPLVLHALIRQESMFQADVLSSAGAVGLMQLMPRTATDTARREKLPKPSRIDLTRPAVNVRLGAAYLAHLLRYFNGDYFRAVAAYNGGEKAVSRWWEGAGGDPAVFLERVSYQETRFYLRKVFLNLLQYYRIYRPAMYARYLPSVPAAAPRDPGAVPPAQPSDPSAGALPPPPMPGAAPIDAPPTTETDGM